MTSKKQSHTESLTRKLIAHERRISKLESDILEFLTLKDAIEKQFPGFDELVIQPTKKPLKDKP